MSLKLIRTKPYISCKEVKDKELIIPTKLLTSIDRENGNDDRFIGTVIDPAINVTGAAIPIPSNYDMINIYSARNSLNMKYLAVDRGISDYIRNQDEDLIIKIPKDSFIYMPPGISTPFSTQSGLDIFTNLQNRFDNMLECYINWVNNDHVYDKQLELRWLQCYNRLVEEVTKMLVGRGGLYEKTVGCQWKHSMRAVIIPDPSLQLNEVEIPRSILITWLQDIKFRKAYGIDEDMPIRDAARVMEGKRVMIGRNPSHDMSNLMSFKLRTYHPDIK